MNRKEKTTVKKLIALVLTLMFTLTAVAAFAEEPAATDTPSRTLVVYYSATGSTERIANRRGRQNCSPRLFV